MRKTKITPVPKKNLKRGIAKFKRGYGKLAIEKANMTQNEWSQKYDPLFKIKGKERHRRSHS